MRFYVLNDAFRLTHSFLLSFLPEQTKCHMASLTKHPKSSFWTACYTNSEGRQLKRSTKTTDRNKAYEIALELERVEKQTRAGITTTNQLKKILNEVSE